MPETKKKTEKQPKKRKISTFEVLELAEKLFDTIAAQIDDPDADLEAAWDQVAEIFSWATQSGAKTLVEASTLAWHTLKTQKVELMKEWVKERAWLDKDSLLPN